MNLRKAGGWRGLERGLYPSEDEDEGSRWWRRGSLGQQFAFRWRIEIHRVSNR